MKRKDGQQKIRSHRKMPVYDSGFRPRFPRSFPTPISDQFSVVSMFSGCGGLDLGFQGGFSVYGNEFPALPFDIIGAYDNFDDAVTTYRLNIGSEINNSDLASIDVSLLPQAEVLLGGFPCQDFSSSGPKVGLSGARGQLYKSLVCYMQKYRPKIVIGENVPYLARLSGGAYLKTILYDLEAVGYRFRVWDIHCPSYGLPQSRRRLFLVGVRDDLNGFPRKPSPTHESRYFSVDAAISDLEHITDETITNQSQYFVATRATSGGGQGDHTNRVGDVSYCIRANARGRIQFHYSLDRRLTVRECARLQSFPDSFVFPFSTQRNLTLIGNAVPPIIGHQVATSIRNFLRGDCSDAVNGMCDFLQGQKNSQRELAL